MAGVRLHSDEANLEEALYPKLGQVVDAEDVAPMSIESLCMNCHENGMTRLLFTQIPFFRQVIIMSFRCPHCGFSNNEMQPAAAVQPMGCKYTTKLTSVEDLQRQIVKGDAATVRFEELDFEVPKGKGVLTTVEGLLTNALDELRETQEARREHDPNLADQVEEFIGRLALTVSGASMPLTIVVDDPSGNSFLENPSAPNKDPNMTRESYKRTPEQQESLGLQQEQYELEGEQSAGPGEENTGSAEASGSQEETEEAKEARRAEIAKTFQVKPGSRIYEKRDDSAMMANEVFQIPTPCPACSTEGSTKSCITNVPYFREIIIMAFDCLKCGYKTNEVKAGGAIPEQGQVISLRVPKKTGLEDCQWADDMKRDVVKSNSAGIQIPELELEVTPGSLGGLYSTVEGMLTLARDTLFDGTATDFAKGDSAPTTVKSKFSAFEERFRQVIEGEIDFTLIIVDPLACSFIYSPTAPEPEPRLTVTNYERTFDENDELGLNDMKTENYDAESSVSGSAAAHSPSQQFSAPVEGRLCELCDTFQGARPGQIFILGSQGLGYYEDMHKDAVMARMRGLQKDGKNAHPNPNAVQENQK